MSNILSDKDKTTCVRFSLKSSFKALLLMQSSTFPASNNCTNYELIKNTFLKILNGVS